MPPQAAGLAEARSPAPRKHMHPIAFPPHSKSPSAFHKAEGALFNHYYVFIHVCSVGAPAVT